MTLVEALIEPNIALIAALPPFTAKTRPLELTVAAAVFEEDHVT